MSREHHDSIFQLLLLTSGDFLIFSHHSALSLTTRKSFAVVSSCWCLWRLVFLYSRGDARNEVPIPSILNHPKCSGAIRALRFVEEKMSRGQCGPSPTCISCSLPLLKYVHSSQLCTWAALSHNIMQSEWLPEKSAKGTHSSVMYHSWFFKVFGLHMLMTY